MKRVGNLIDKIASPENLRLAFTKAVRGKQDRKEVIEFRSDFDINITRLSYQLSSGSVALGNYHFFHVCDPKKRLICAASFPERVIHHAIMNICEAVLERFAVFDSYACRRGKGLRRAVKKAQYFSRKNNWYLKLDIHKYFDSINHRVMRDLLRKRFKDEAVLQLFSDLLATYHITPGIGVPIGNLISQHLANFYLGLMDHWIKEERKIRCYLRYMDDFVLFAESKDQLKDEFQQLTNFLGNHLALSIKDDWSLNRCSTGIPYLGFHIFPGSVRLGKRSKMRFIEKFRQYEFLYKSGIWSEEELSQHITP
ncbi:MAG TPA: hypothetical protein EYP35_02935, partial [Desulfobacterales bacterium]|nr:hypothetical protein [Desulfobacterales bacterium]